MVNDIVRTVVMLERIRKQTGPVGYCPSGLRCVWFREPLKYYQNNFRLLYDLYFYVGKVVCEGEIHQRVSTKNNDNNSNITKE